MAAEQTKGARAQRKILAAIDHHWRTQGYAPTYRELGLSVGLAHSGVHAHLQALKQRGLVDENPNRARTLRLSDAGRIALADTEEPR